MIDDEHFFLQFRFCVDPSSNMKIKEWVHYISFSFVSSYIFLKC